MAFGQFAGSFALSLTVSLLFVELRFGFGRRFADSSRAPVESGVEQKRN
jgi:hypothetical protein